MTHSFTSDPHTTGRYTMCRNNIPIGEISFLMEPAFLPEVLSRFAGILDEASVAARNFDEMTS